ncbi:MAG TPA: glycosyltransferase [Verrucomicrobiae bacterium]|nr:glycosyltransferase [Verrucomicrobiae bacterium]
MNRNIISKLAGEKFNATKDRSEAGPTRPFRVMYVLKNYPQMSETYIKTEIEAVRPYCEISIVSTRKANLPAREHEPYRYLDDSSRIREAIEEFRPDVLHSHWLHSVKMLGLLARQTGVPFTVRAHSFDSIWPEDYSVFGHVPLLTMFSRPSHIRRTVRFIEDDLCLGVLTFPFARARLEQAGFPKSKLVDCFPVMNYQRFYDASPNGDANMNVGACIPKKKMEDFVELAIRAPAQEFNLYALGYNTAQLQEFARARQSPVHFMPFLELEDMAAEYKKHRWLVYTAAPGGRVGWPMAIAEAQASGVGVCMANIRPDLREYGGPSAFFYDSLDQALKIIQQPYPEELRQLGFSHALKSDIAQHRSLLFRLWRMPQYAAQGSNAARNEAVAALGGSS